MDMKSGSLNISQRSYKVPLMRRLITEKVIHLRLWPERIASVVQGLVVGEIVSLGDIVRLTAIAC